MRIEANKQVNNRRLGDASGRESRQGFVNHAFERHLDESNDVSRELVAVNAPDDTTPAAPYRDAAFLAHLIATKVHAPQTRERRRAEPGDAAAAYQAMAALTNH